MKRQDLLSYIRKKKIVLFGAGDKGRKFYVDFCRELKIDHCISNNPEEKVFKIENNRICDVMPIGKSVKNEDDFIIICASDSISMQTQLSDLGYCMGMDYIDSELYRILAGDKKIALFYGVCYMRAIKECLDYSDAFRGNYNSFYFLDYVKYSMTEKSLFYLLIESCDLFIFTSYLAPHSLRQLDAFFLRLKNDCTKVSIPLITFTGFHPRIRGKVNDSNPYCIISSKAPYSPFSIEDLNINSLIEEHKFTSEIVDIVSDLNYYSKDFLENNLVKEIQRLRFAEKFSNIKISDFIQENYDKARLFLNESHISNILLIELSKRILIYLKIPFGNLEEVVTALPPLLYTTEVPVYPSIIHHLKLNIYKGEPVYKLFTYQGMRSITFKEYVTLYIEYCRNMKMYIEKGYFPN